MPSTGDTNQSAPSIKLETSRRQLLALGDWFACGEGGTRHMTRVSNVSFFSRFVSVAKGVQCY